MSYTKAERLILYNQYEILKRLPETDSEYVKRYESYQEILSSGYTRNYWEFDECICDEFPTGKANFVYDLLDMFRDIYDSCEKLPSDVAITIERRRAEFRGFDGNNESEYLGYARFLLDDLNLYEESKRGDYNTHWPILSTYQSMLHKYRQIIADKLLCPQSLYQPVS